MPNIRQFDTPALGLRPSEVGVDATAQAARRIGAFSNQLASDTGQLGAFEGDELRNVGARAGSAVAAAGDAAVDYMDHREISAGAAKGTELMANLTQQWNKTISDPKVDPNDPSIAKRFLTEQLEPALDQFQQGFTTEKSQQFAEQFVNRFRQHMFEKTSADMSTMAGIAAKANAETTINSLSSMVANDPSSLDAALATAEHAIGAKVESSPTLSPEDSMRVRTEVGLKAKESIVKSAIVGMIQKNPNIDLSGIQKKYGEYINGAEMKMFQKSAQVQARADLAAQKQVAILKRQMADQNMHAGLNKVISDNVSIDPRSGRPVINPNIYQKTLDLARRYPDAPSAAGTVRTMLTWAQAEQNRENRPTDDPQVVRDLSDRMFSADNPTTTIDLMKAHAAGQMSDHTFTEMNGLVKELAQTPLKGPIYQDTMKAVHSTLNLVGQNGFADLKDPIGERNYAKFVQTFIPQYLSKYRAGTLEPNALDVNDPNSFISKAMAPFRNRSMQSDLQVQAATPAPEKPKSNKPEVPFELRGIADLSYSKSRNLWRDNLTGKIYGADGKEVGK